MRTGGTQFQPSMTTGRTIRTLRTNTTIRMRTIRTSTTVQYTGRTIRTLRTNTTIRMRTIRTSTNRQVHGANHQDRSNRTSTGANHQDTSDKHHHPDANHQDGVQPSVPGRTIRTLRTNTTIRMRTIRTSPKTSVHKHGANHREHSGQTPPSGCEPSGHSSDLSRTHFSLSAS